MSDSTFPIVAIGASAGGLGALKSFFESMPATSGAAYVVIQHLHPKHESLIADILSRSTKMPVLQIKAGMAIAPNHVYVIPPNQYLGLKGNVFTLSEAVAHSGLRLPVDAFFRSIAEQQASRAIAIIFSGTGSDGALGLRMVKASGGLVLAQAPETAEFDGMPSNAIATGMVDLICPISEMPGYLLGYFQHPYVGSNASNATDADPLGAQAEALDAILAVLQTHIGQDFRAYKKGTLQRRISRRMGLRQMRSMAEYATFLRNNEEEAKLLYQDLLIGVTDFFRDPAAFESLRTQVIVPMVTRKTFDQPIRIWVPGCSTGQEAYSIAMLLLEEMDSVHKSCPIQIFATDLDESALAVARKGLYPFNIVESINPARLQRFFVEQDKGFQVSKRLRATISFAVQNLISDPPFSNLDLISCRNLLIYLRADVQSRVLGMFHFALNDAGCLLLGQSETSSQPEGLFEALDKKWRIYQRVKLAQSPTAYFPSGTRPKKAAPVFASLPGPSAEPTRMNEIAQQYLLQEYAPAAVLVKGQSQIVNFYGPTAHYLQQPSGSPSQDLLVLAKHELKARLRTALRQMAVEPKRMLIDDAFISRDSDQVPVRITLRPINVPRLSDSLTLITFEDRPKVSLGNGQEPASQMVTGSWLLDRMGNDLDITRKDLQSSIEDLESANQDLQAANEEVRAVCEELQSSNEELQSSNEELESSKEELQSINEELSTVNNQYKEKVEELSHANDDISYLLKSTNMATLFIDAGLNIGRFTPAIKGFMNLIPSDIGRPLSDIKPNFDDQNLLDDVREVLANLSSKEAEITTNEGRSYLRRIVAYLNPENRLEGVVITFVDLTSLQAARRAESASAAKSRFLATASHDLRQPLQVLTMLNTALLKDINQPKARQMLLLQGESLKSMAQLLNALLDISKLESGTVNVQRSEFELQPFLQQLLTECGAQAQEKGLSLSLEMPSALTVSSDPVLLAQLLRNLLANALRYTQAGFVKLSATADNDQVIISVRDSGIGIPEEHLEDIFDEFYQVNRAPYERHGGLGLGLSIVHRIAELLDSHVKVLSKPGEGTTFSLNLAKGRSIDPGAVKDDPALATEVYSKDVKRVQTAESVSSGEPIKALDKPPKAVILLVDDDADVLAATNMLLAMEKDLKIMTAASSMEALELVSMHPPNLVISDLHLSNGMNGMEIIRQARSTTNRQIPAILLTGDTSKNTEELDREGIVVLIKPVETEKLISTIKRLLAELA